MGKENEVMDAKPEVTSVLMLVRTQGSDTLIGEVDVPCEGAEVFVMKNAFNIERMIVPERGPDGQPNLRSVVTLGPLVASDEKLNFTLKIRWTYYFEVPENSNLAQMYVEVRSKCSGISIPRLNTSRIKLN